MPRHFKLCHTSDWHLGHTLHGHARDHEHARFLSFLTDAIVTERADALIVAGDVFDGANPPASAQAMLYGFLAELRARAPRCDVLIVAGNHDSPARLAAPDPVLRALGVRVVGALPRTDPSAVCVPLHDRGGEVAAWCAALPFLRTSDLVVDRATDPAAVEAGTRGAIASAIDAARSRCKPGQALLATGHCHMVDAQASESERTLRDAIAVDAYADDVAYVALGHLHLAQAIGRPHVRYSGSPIPLSLAEETYPHQIRMVRFEGARLGGQEELRVPRAVDVIRVPREGPAELESVLAQLGRLELAEAPVERQPYLEVRVRLSEPVPDLRQKIEGAIAGRPVRLVKIAVECAGAKAALADRERRDLSDLTIEEVFRRCYARRYDGEPSPELWSAFDEVARAAREKEAE